MIAIECYACKIANMLVGGITAENLSQNYLTLDGDLFSEVKRRPWADTATYLLGKVGKR